VTASQIALSWSASTDNTGVSGYQISRCQGTGCNNFAAVGTSSTTAYQDSGLTAATSYSYRVTAKDLAGNVSAPSNVLSATTASVQPPSSAISLVQHAGKDAGITTTSTLGFPQANTAGNWIAVAVRAGKMGQQFVISDSRGNVYRRAAQLDESVDITTVALFYAENIAGGVNTVSVFDSIDGGTLRFAIAEYSGVAKSNSLDAAAVAQGTNASPQTPAITTTVPGDLVIGLISTAEPATFTAGSGYTIEERVPAAPNAKFVLEDRVLATPGSVFASATLGSGDIWGALVAAFRPAP
jgi:hypothetical protein